MRTIFWYLYFAVSALFKIPSYRHCLRVKEHMPKEKYRSLVYEITSSWAERQIKNSGAKINIVGEENIPKGTVLFVSNHQSNFDIAVIMACIKKEKGFVAKKELLKLPLIRDWMVEMECVFLDRSDIRASAKAITDAINILKKGQSMVVFPEGTRSKERKMGEFKSGSFKLATKSKVPIVPITIDGTYKIMEENNNRIKPAEVKITIHKPIDTEGISKDEENELPEKVKGIIAAGFDSI